MTDTLAAIAGGLRLVLLAGGVTIALVATADWAVRTRRINPFGGVARFMRSRLDPQLVGIERQVARAGGQPANTPWWAFVLYIIFAALLLAALDVVQSLAYEAQAAATLGGAGIAALVLHWVFRFLGFALLVRVIASWFPRAAHGVWMRWAFASTEWMLRPLRRLIPTIGMMDITPIVAYFALQILERLLASVLFPTI